jgi:FkbM family methyltransferase
MQQLQHALRDIQLHEILGHKFHVEDLASSDLRRIVVGELNRDVYELQTLPQPGHVLDIGANIGLFAMTAAALWPKCHLRCYEPHPVNFTSLSANLARADVRATRVNKAVTAAGRKLQMVIGTDNTGGATGWTENARKGVATITCPGATLHSALDNKYHDLVKIDIEGGEHELLFEFTHWSMIGALVIELHENKTIRAEGYTMAETESYIRNRMGRKTVVVTRCEMGE